MTALTERVLIVNADDFGQSPWINQGVIAAHEQGVVTSASLMVRWPAAADAAAQARAHPALSVGLHLDFGEWAYRNDAWVPVYEVLASRERAAIADEIDRQIEEFRKLLGRSPTHLDSHQHVHREEPTRALLVERAQALGIPVRHYTPTVRYSGEFYGQTGKGEPLPDAISLPAFLDVIMTLPGGVTELGCHPGAPGTLDSMYVNERPDELAVLCHPLVKEAIAGGGIALRSFAEVNLRKEASHV